jgi:glycosyltransferase involved in cell wall biosynthesis
MISLCITTYNRDQLTVDSFAQVLNDDRISEIVIVDDHSDETIYNNLAWLVNGMDKVRLFRNPKNLGCYHNKRMAVECASNEWVILFDSDNVIGKDYIDALFNYNPKMDDGSFSGWAKWVIYQPEFAMPHFNFTAYSNKSFDKGLAKNYMPQMTFQTMLNAMNFFVNRAEYLRVFDSSKEEPWTADSIYFNYLWLKSGGSIFVTPELRYMHLVHDGSHYKNNVHKTGNFYNEVVQKLKEL